MWIFPLKPSIKKTQVYTGIVKRSRVITACSHVICVLGIIVGDEVVRLHGKCADIFMIFFVINEPFLFVFVRYFNYADS
ncbi:EC1118_1C17_1662p [Saccharomyces cerevisiae EC1118]|uniref:EC1118_1C17_1662p n=1 Tax=Saccharomyces cerevisiae (strain Lalvin EC1118 / Prise de mousse) TaxID=643680 RepID=C8Z4G8_YEAS8|nr:EC1118_1C17_1662p [Saccharomyces cerevisiae EC1118]